MCARMPRLRSEQKLTISLLYPAGRVVVQFEKDPCQGIGFRRAGKLGDSITPVAQVFDTPRAQGLKPVPIGFSFGTAEAVP
jgi:hypothetical protein